MTPPRFFARTVAAAVALLTAAPPAARAQEIFVAPSHASIFADVEQSMGAIPAHLLFITNKSSVPIIIFGIVLTECENIRQSCGGSRMNTRVDAGQRRKVFEVSQKYPDRTWNYRWNYSYRPDSSDEKAIAALRAHNLVVEATKPETTRVIYHISRVDTVPPADLSAADSSKLVAAAEARAARLFPSYKRDSSTTSQAAFRFKVAYGSILGSTMQPGAALQLTGPCINPQEAARYEADKKIPANAWRPPVLGNAAPIVRVPADLEDSTIKDGDPLLRFIVDTTGDVIPESVSVLESPHALVSVSACKSAIQAHATPARDKAGKVIRAWLQVPFRMFRTAH